MAETPLVVPRSAHVSLQDFLESLPPNATAETITRHHEWTGSVTKMLKENLVDYNAAADATERATVLLAEVRSRGVRSWSRLLLTDRIATQGATYNRIAFFVQVVITALALGFAFFQCVQIAVTEAPRPKTLVVPPHISQSLQQMLVWDPDSLSVQNLQRVDWVNDLQIIARSNGFAGNPRQVAMAILGKIQQDVNETNPTAWSRFEKTFSFQLLQMLAGLWGTKFALMVLAKTLAP